MGVALDRLTGRAFVLQVVKLKEVVMESRTPGSAPVDAPGW